MGKNIKKEPTFGGNGLFDGLEPTNTEKPTHEYTHTPTYTHTPKAKELKNARANLLMKPSVKKALIDYAKAHDTSMNDIINMLVEKFLEENR